MVMLKHKTTQQSTRQRTHDKCHCQGFTLAEVIIVMAIIAIMATFAIPSFLHWLPNIRLKEAGRDLFSNMQMTKIKAIKTNRDWRISFDTVNNNYSILDSGDGDWATLPDNTSETFELSEYKSEIGIGHGNATLNVPGVAFGADVSYGGNLVTFNPRGTCNSGYAYLDNEQNTAIAIGTMTSGVIRYVQWRGTGWQ